MARIFITGASGCVGQYIVEALIQQTDHELFLLVRNPAKLTVDVEQRPGVQVITGDLLHIEGHEALLKTMDVAILTAAAWGDPQQTQLVNVTKTLALLKRLDPSRCRQVIYFSTASILDQQNRLLAEAGWPMTLALLGPMDQSGSAGASAHARRRAAPAAWPGHARARHRPPAA